MLPTDPGISPGWLVPVGRLSCMYVKACWTLLGGAGPCWVPGGSQHFAVEALEIQPGSGVGYLHGSAHGVCGGGFSSEQHCVVLLCGVREDWRGLLALALEVPLVWAQSYVTMALLLHVPCECTPGLVK